MADLLTKEQQEQLQKLTPLGRLDHLYQSLSATLAGQETDYNETVKKAEVLIGFIVAVSSAYFAFVKNTNSSLKSIALGLFILAIVVLCFVYRNRDVYKPALPETDIDTDIIDARYQEVVDLECACKANDNILNNVTKNVDLGIKIFAAGVIFLILSLFI